MWLQTTIPFKFNNRYRRVYSIIRKTLEAFGIFILIFILPTIVLNTPSQLANQKFNPGHNNRIAETLEIPISSTTIITTPAPVTSSSHTPKTSIPPQLSTSPIQPTNKQKPLQKIPFTANSLYTAKVTRVIDGDTIVIALNQTHSKLRYIGINTPEYKTNACLAQKATEINRSLVLNKPILIAKDVRETDKYGRLLRYVFVPRHAITSNRVKTLLRDSQSIYVYNGVEYVFVNQFLVEQGYAEAMTIPPDTKFAKLFQELNRKAHEQELGIYSTSVCADSAITDTHIYNQPPQTHTPTPETVTTNSQECYNVTCSYNAYNCSDFTSYQEAYQVYQCCLKQTGKDIHRLDRDQDGIPCESLR